MVLLLHDKNTYNLEILVIDNYDSFTWNLVHILSELGNEVSIERNDEVVVYEAIRFKKILLSPGSGLPDAAGKMQELISKCSNDNSILGICLGMQGIALHYGAKMNNMGNVSHGVETIVNITEPNESLFYNLPQQFHAGLYHSWSVDEKSLPGCLTITARNQNGTIMALSHKKADVKGVQFHPESIMTPEGKQIIKNWINT